MISDNEMLFNHIEKVCGGDYERERFSRGNYPGSYCCNQPQGSCCFTRNDFYSPVVQCYNPNGSHNIYDNNRYNIGTNPFNFRIRFEKIEELIK